MVARLQWEVVTLQMRRVIIMITIKYQMVILGAVHILRRKWEVVPYT